MVFSIITAPENDSQRHNSYNVLDQGWTYGFDGGTKPVSLPYAFSNPDMKPYTISYTFGSDMPEYDNDMYIVGYYSNFDVYLDGSLIYRCDKGSRRTPGKEYVIVDMPDKLSGRTVTIEYKPHLNVGKFKIVPPYIGDKGDIIRSVFFDDIFDMLLLIIGTAMGAALVIIAIFIRFNVQYMNINILSTGLFALFSGAYMLSRLECIRMIFDVDYILYLIEFNSLMVLMLPILILLMSVFTGTSRVIVKILLYINIINVAAEETLSLLNVSTLREMLTINHIVLIATAGTFLYCLYARREIIDEYRFEMTVSIIPLVVFSALDVATHYLRTNMRSGMMLKIGIIFFLCFEIFFIIKKYNKVNSDMQRYKLYREMALKDIATGLNNRNAYEQFCKRLESHRDIYNNICCAVFDLNSLKISNDTFGHAAGDELICAMARILKNIFDGKGSVFRTGGDEFVVVMSGSSEDEFNKLVDSISSETENATLSYNIKIDYSFGVASFDEGIFPSVADMLKEADNRMYEDKKNNHNSRSYMGR